MLRITFSCDKCNAGQPEFDKDLTTVICKACGHKESLRDRLAISKGEPKLTMRAFIAHDPQGVRHDGVGVAYFAKKHKLNPNRIQACLKDPETNCNGWTFLDKGLLYFHTMEEMRAAYKA